MGHKSIFTLFSRTESSKSLPALWHLTSATGIEKKSVLGNINKSLKDIPLNLYCVIYYLKEARVNLRTFSSPASSKSIPGLWHLTLATGRKKKVGVTSTNHKKVRNCTLWSTISARHTSTLALHFFHCEFKIDTSFVTLDPERRKEERVNVYSPEQNSWAD